MASTADPTEAKAVIMTTDVSGLIFWASLRTSNPSILSILMSVMTMSKFSFLMSVKGLLAVIGFLDGSIPPCSEDVQCHADVFFIVNDQNIGFLSMTSGLPLLFFYRKNDGEYRPFADFALYPDVAVEPFDDIVAQRKTETGALSHFLGRVKRIEDLFELLFGDPDAGIGELDHEWNLSRNHPGPVSSLCSGFLPRASHPAHSG